MAVAAVLVAPHRLAAQRTVSALMLVQNLDFGGVTGGIPEIVRTTDTWRRAEVRLEGSGQLNVRFILPTALVSTTGAQLPLTFGAADGAYASPKQPTPTPFNPAAGTKINLTASGGAASVFLGGTASAATGQPAGRYSGTIVLVVAPPNQ